MTQNQKKSRKLTLTRTTILGLNDLRIVAGGATLDCHVKNSGGCYNTRDC